MGLKTALYDTHVRQGAKIVDFGGWEMPLHYGSQIEEHHAVRRDAGMFDVSHMGVVDLTGYRVREFLRMLAGQRCRPPERFPARRCTPACCCRTAASSTI